MIVFHNKKTITKYRATVVGNKEEYIFRPNNPTIAKDTKKEPLKPFLYCILGFNCTTICDFFLNLKKNRIKENKRISKNRLIKRKRGFDRNCCGLLNVTKENNPIMESKISTKREYMKLGLFWSCINCFVSYFYQI